MDCNLKEKKNTKAIGARIAIQRSGVPKIRFINCGELATKKAVAPDIARAIAIKL